MSRELLVAWVIRALLLVPVFAMPAFCFDAGSWNAQLEELGQGVSQTAYTLSERAGTAERAVYDAAIEKTEKAQGNLGKMIGQIESAEDLLAALEATRTYGSGDAAKAYTSGVAVKMLKERAAFLKVELPADQSVDSALTQITLETTPQVNDVRTLLTNSQRALIMVQTPVAEAVISFEDGKEQRRLNAFKAMIDRHECRVISSAVDKSGEQPRYNFYLSGKKFVLEAMIRHYGGQEVNSNLKAVLVLTGGGFWGQKTVEVTVNPTSQEKGTLAWYQAVLEKDPYKYVAETQYETIAQLGKVETLAGENKLRIKNAKMELWVMPANGTRRDVIYYNSAEYGDIYVSAR